MICKTCKQDKDEKCFYKQNGRIKKDCKECTKEKRKIFYKEKREEIRKKQEEYYCNNKEKFQEKSIKYREKNRDKLTASRKEYYKENKTVILKQKQEYYRKNKQKIERYKKEYYKNNPHKLKEASLKKCEKRRNNFTQRLSNIIGGSLRKNIQKKYKTSIYIKMFGYTIDDLMKHLEDRLDDKMTWNNYGKYWHIDHIKPVSLFNFEKEQELIECWSLGNLQPLEAGENIRKRNIYPYNPEKTNA